MAYSLPRELRILIALAAAALLGGALIGFAPQDAGAVPDGGPYIQPCVSSYSGQISHANAECPPGTYRLDLSTADKTLCISKYTARVSYRPASECTSSEFSYYADGSNQIWGCVNPWTGSVSWMQTQVSPCYGQAMPFDTGYYGCTSVAAPAAAEKFAFAPTC